MDGWMDETLFKEGKPGKLNAYLPQGPELL